MSGLRVQADSQVAFLSGNAGASVPDVNTWHSDPSFEYMPPLTTAGYRFAVHGVPGKTGARTYFRSVATQPGTTVRARRGDACWVTKRRPLRKAAASLRPAGARGAS